MKASEYVEIFATKTGRHYKFFALKNNGDVIEIRTKTRRFYPIAYEFDHDIHPCKTEVGKKFIISGKTIRFTNHQPIKTHTVSNRGG